MSTILNRLVERLDVKIRQLRRVKKRLQEKKLTDRKLNYQLNRLISIRDNLKKRSTGK